MINSENNQLKALADNAELYPLQRYIVSCSRVIAADKCSDQQILVGNKVIRNFTYSDFAVCTVEKGGFLLLDFGMELSGGVRIVTNIMTPCRVRLRFGESVAEACSEPTRDHAIHDVELTLCQLASIDFGNTGFRFVRLDVAEGTLKLVNLCAIAEVHPYKQLGYFTSSDERLNAVFNTAVHTVSCCIQDYVLDGIKRDRLLWGGDMHPEVLAILSVYGAIPPMEKTVEQLCKHTQQGKFINGHVSYSMWMLKVIFDLWLYSGDESLLNKYKEFVLDATARYLKMIAPDGTVHFEGYAFLDWPSSDVPEEVNAGLHGLLSLALEASCNMYKHWQLDTAEIEAALSNLKLQVPHPGTNKGAAALQHLAGLADRSDVLENEPFKRISTFLGGYVLSAKNNAAALELVKTYWGGMLDMHATSFWEDFDLAWCEDNPTGVDEMPMAGRKNIHADFGGYCYKGLRHSLCHGWAAGPVSWCMQNILGLRVLDCGCKKISFTPDLCGLEFAEGTFPTPLGLVKVSLRAGSEPQITVPDGIEVVRA
ncbi:MAG: alpha-L-rhamnosidase [Lentisphaerae bacterium]|nr:alpha-L-rhamnosidase [Lentisphaerota bacterium]